MSPDVNAVDDLSESEEEDGIDAISRSQEISSSVDAMMPEYTTPTAPPAPMMRRGRDARRPSLDAAYQAVDELGSVSAAPLRK